MLYRFSLEVKVSAWKHDNKERKHLISFMISTIFQCWFAWVYKEQFQLILCLPKWKKKKNSQDYSFIMPGKNVLWHFPQVSSFALSLYLCLFHFLTGSPQLVHVIPVENPTYHAEYRCVTEPEVKNTKYSWRR